LSINQNKNSIKNIESENQGTIILPN